MVLIKKIILTIVVIVLVIVIFEAMRVLLNPLTQPEEKIRERMLSQFPTGTQMEGVLHFVSNEKGWSDLKIDNTNGYYKNVVLGEVVGQKHISIYIGTYRNIKSFYFKTDVQMFIGFNEKSELIDIRVRKMSDSL
ncbi:hypothetical protein [Paenibacillus sinopodophylli]|uniref:hypothetical protein n=1 Tax=Paenibacillus sinopodophylli TaxID=1837342 RepID=UPI00110CA7EA|nr:hypothetical protein [Paenibacillus sinopodophylli]